MPDSTQVPWHPEDEGLTTTEAARVLGVSTERVRQLCLDGTLAHVRVPSAGKRPFRYLVSAASVLQHHRSAIDGRSAELTTADIELELANSDNADLRARNAVLQVQVENLTALLATAHDQLDRHRQALHHLTAPVRGAQRNQA